MQQHIAVLHAIKQATKWSKHKESAHLKHTKTRYDVFRNHAEIFLPCIRANINQHTEEIPKYTVPKAQTRPRMKVEHHAEFSAKQTEKKNQHNATFTRTIQHQVATKWSLGGTNNIFSFVFQTILTPANHTRNKQKKNKKGKKLDFYVDIELGMMFSGEKEKEGETHLLQKKRNKKTKTRLGKPDTTPLPKKKRNKKLQTTKTIEIKRTKTTHRQKRTKSQKRIRKVLNKCETMFLHAVNMTHSSPQK